MALPYTASTSVNAINRTRYTGEQFKRLFELNLPPTQISYGESTTIAGAANVNILSAPGAGRALYIHEFALFPTGTAWTGPGACHLRIGTTAFRGFVAIDETNTTAIDWLPFYIGATLPADTALNLLNNGANAINHLVYVKWAVVVSS